MRKALLGIGAALVALAFCGSAKAADWCGPSGYGVYGGSGYYNGSGYYGSSGYGYSDYGYRSYSPGHYDYVPGQYQRHWLHYDYVPPHVDYHAGHRRYEVIPTLGGSYISPRHHHHR